MASFWAGLKCNVIHPIIFYSCTWKDPFINSMSKGSIWKSSVHETLLIISYNCMFEFLTTDFFHFAGWWWKFHITFWATDSHILNTTFRFLSTYMALHFKFYWSSQGWLIKLVNVGWIFRWWYQWLSSIDFLIILCCCCCSCGIWYSGICTFSLIRWLH